MGNQNQSFNRFLVYILGLLISLIGYLGDREFDRYDRELEKAQAACKLSYESLRDSFNRALIEIRETQTKDTTRIDSLESYRIEQKRISEGQGKLLGEVQGSIRVIEREQQTTARDMLRVEGHRKRND